MVENCTDAPSELKAHTNPKLVKLVETFCKNRRLFCHFKKTNVTNLKTNEIINKATLIRRLLNKLK